MSIVSIAWIPSVMTNYGYQSLSQHQWRHPDGHHVEVDDGTVQHWPAGTNRTGSAPFSSNDPDEVSQYLISLHHKKRRKHHESRADIMIKSALEG